MPNVNGAMDEFPKRWGLPVVFLISIAGLLLTFAVRPDPTAYDAKTATSIAAAEHDADGAKPVIPAAGQASSDPSSAIAAQPNPVAALPDSVATQPDPVAAQPNIGAAQADIVAARPDPVAVFRRHVQRHVELRNRTISALRAFMRIAAGRPNLEVKNSVHWEPFRPVVVCDTERRMGTAYDGGKWVCPVPKLLRREPCLVYSFGSNGQSDFENAVYTEFGCEIHVFDPTLEPIGIQRVQQWVDRGVLKFHPWGVAPFDGEAEFRRGDEVFNATVKTLDSIMHELGHTALDILKLDIESFEWVVLQDFVRQGMPPVGQLLVEIHMYGFMRVLRGHRYERLAVLFDHLETNGLFAFHSEVNALNDDCSEIAFVNESLFPELATAVQ